LTLVQSSAVGSDYGDPTMLDDFSKAFDRIDQYSVITKNCA